MTRCPVCGMLVDEDTAPSLEYGGKIYYFMNPFHKEIFVKDPARFQRRSSNHESHTPDDMEM